MPVLVAVGGADLLTPPKQSLEIHRHRRFDAERQWLWTGSPQRGSRSWRSIPARNDASGQGWLVVIDAGFYDRHDNIYGDLKLRPGAQPLSLITFAVVRRIAAGD